MIEKSLPKSFSYRPEIDGLRAIAVLSVVFYHAKLGFTGGFVGVDVFFVISGYLITSIIWRDMKSDRFTFLNFWEKRARRIFPPLIVVTLATLLVGAIFYLPYDLRRLSNAVAAQVVFAANIFYWRDIPNGYFAESAEHRPLLHTWSLAVEEQFYLFWPVALFFIRKVRDSIRDNIAILIVVVSMGFSFILSVYGVAKSPSATFYLLPTRAWELLLGAFVALILARSATRFAEQKRFNFLSIAGLAFILVPVFFYDHKTVFPGMSALWPCLGTSLLIVGTDGKESRCLIKRLLSTRAFVFIGLVSYSFYLWHWPIFAVYEYHALLVGRSYFTGPILVLCSFGASILSWQYIEKPFRNKDIISKRKLVFVFSGISALVLLAFSFGILSVKGNLGGWKKDVEEMTMGGQVSFRSHARKSVRQKKLLAIGNIEQKNEVFFCIWGDSHAVSALPAFNEFFVKAGRFGKAALHAGAPPVLVKHNPEDFYFPQERVDENFKKIVQNRPKVVFLVAKWNKYSEIPNFSDDLIETVCKLREFDVLPVVMMMVPNHRSIGKHRTSFALLTQYQKERQFLEDVDTIDYSDGLGKDFKSLLEASGGIVIDPKLDFLGPNGKQFEVRMKNKMMYIDNNHLNDFGAMNVLLPFLEEKLPSIIERVLSNTR